MAKEVPNMVGNAAWMAIARVGWYHSVRVVLASFQEMQGFTNKMCGPVLWFPKQNSWYWKDTITPLLRNEIVW